MLSDYRFMPVRDALVLTTGYVAGTVIGKSAPPNYLSGPVGLLNQLILYIDYTKGGLSSAQIKIEFSDDGVDWYQETHDDPGAPAAGLVTMSESIMTREITITGKFRIPLPITDQYIRVSVKGTGDPTGSSMKVGAIVGYNG